MIRKIVIAALCFASAAFGQAVGGNGAPGATTNGNLPVASTAGQVPTSTGAGTTYTAQTPSSSGATYVAPSGDTTGATDCGNIQTALTASAAVQLGVGTYYVGHSNTACTFSTAATVKGLGPARTIIQNEGTTSDAIAVNANITTISGPPYPNPFPNGGTLSDFSIIEDSGLTPTAGGCLSIGTNGTGVTQGFVFNNINLAGCYQDLHIYPGFWNNKLTNMTLSNPVSTNAVYYDSPAPNGDAFFDNIFLEGVSPTAAANFYINRGDTSKFRGIKINNGNYIFGTGGTSNFIMTDTGIEGQTSCAFDFSGVTTGETGTYMISNVEFENATAQVGFPVCAPQNATNLNISQMCVGYIAGTLTKCFNTPNPNYLVYDNFIGPFPTAITSTETNTVQTWVQFYTNTWPGTIVLTGSGGLGFSSANVAAYYANVSIPSTNHTTSMSCTLGASGGLWCMPMARITSPSASAVPGYGCLFQQGTGVQLLTWSGAGSHSQIGTTDTTYTGGTHTIGVKTNGSSISCVIDGTVSANATGTDSTYTSGYSGLVLNETGGSGYSINSPFTVQ